MTKSDLPEAQVAVRALALAHAAELDGAWKERERVQSYLRGLKGLVDPRKLARDLEEGVHL